MSILFQEKEIISNKLSLETQWRSIILFGKNSASYKFAFAKVLLDSINEEKTSVSLKELSIPFSLHIVEHLKKNDKQGNSQSSKFLNKCRDYIQGRISDDELYSWTEKLGFANVVDAFQNVNGSIIKDTFYSKDYHNGEKKLSIHNSLLQLKESFQFPNFMQEVEVRWRLVETAWSLQVNPKLLEVKYDDQKALFFVENNRMRRVDLTSVRDALNGYQKGKCFYSFQDISINNAENLCEVDHFIPHLSLRIMDNPPININGVWNLVLAEKAVNRDKSSKLPEKKYLERLFNRNEFYIDSKHPLAETIINQTGKTREERCRFLKFQYNLAAGYLGKGWKPKIELPALF